MDLILTLLPPIAAISMFFYMRYQSRRAEEDNERLFPDLETETPSSSSMWQEQLIDLVHLSCAQACWIPTFIRVYFLGVFECLINTLQKYIWTGQSIGREDQIQALVEFARDAETPSLAVVTGGDSGIGCELTKALLQSGVHVIITGRSARVLQHAVQRIKAAVDVDDQALEYLTLELASFQNVRSFVHNLRDHLAGRSIDIFVNNAGVMNCPYEKTADGLELQSQVNAFSTLLLTMSILPFMAKKKARIITTSSSVIYAINHINISNFYAQYKWDGLAAYAQSKLTLVILTKYLSERINSINPNIVLNSCHPGTVRTSLFQYTTIFTLFIFRHLFKFIMLSPAEGILTALHLCLDPTAGTVSGEFWLNRLPRPIGPVTIGMNQEAEEGEFETVMRWLWNTSLDICGMSEKEANKLIESCRL